MSSGAGAEAAQPVVSPWLGLAAIALHNLEEALTIPGWMAVHLPEIVARFGVRPRVIPDARLYASLLVVTLLPALWIALAHRAPARSFAAQSLLALFGIYFANAFVPHLTGALLLRGYVPGVVTAVLLVIPFTLLFVRAGLRGGQYTRLGVAAGLAAGVALYVSVLPFIMMLGR